MCRWIASCCLLYIYFTVIIASCKADSHGGVQEVPFIGKDIDLEHFLKSYDYFDSYKEVKKQTTLDTLAYITPWNSKGCDKAKIFASKFTLISPVWFQLKPTSFKIDGGHDIDKKWIESVKSANEGVKFVPRVVFDGWKADDYQSLFSDNNHRLDCIRKLRDLIKSNGFEGLTLEVWMQHFGTSQQALIDFLVELAKGLHVDGKILVLPIPPSVHKGNFEGRFGRVHFDKLSNHVDYFSLMTYDFSNPYSPGANAPIRWAEKCVRSLVPQDGDSKRAKILMGLNFYGYDYVPGTRQGRAVLSNDVVDVAKKHSPVFEWHEEEAEHSLEYSIGQERHSMYFPTGYSIAKRVALAEELGVGLSIWEIGQGFDSFYEQI